MGSLITKITRQTRTPKAPTASPLVRVPQAPIATPGANLGLLPAPRVPSAATRGADADAIASVVGEDLVAPIRRLDEVVQAAQAAISHLEAHRPGPQGDEWKAALAADFADYAAGNPPTEYRTAALTKTDPDRWAHAQMACRYIPVAAAQCDKELDGKTIRAAAKVVAAEAAEAFDETIEAAWGHRERSSRAWQLREEAEQHLIRYRTARDVADWANGRIAEEGDEDADGFPTKVSAGHWIALDLFLHPEKKLLRVPRNVTWPLGSDRVIGLGQVFFHAPGIDPELGGVHALDKEA